MKHISARELIHVQVLSGLLGPDQPTEVARQAALATRRLADGLVAADSTGVLVPLLSCVPRINADIH